MNAYELADILHQSDFLAMDFAEDAATMLRQQADQIAELEGEVSSLKHINKNWQLSETMAYNRIAELEKLVSEMKYEKSSGVYTHPHKQLLTDDEIAQIESRCKHPLASWAWQLEFARAIIKEITE